MSRQGSISIHGIINQRATEYNRQIALLAVESDKLIAKFLSVPVDQMGVYDRIARVKSRSIKGEAKEMGLKLALSMIDLTTLEGSDTANKVRQMCYKAMHPHENDELPSVAAVCVYPTHIRTAKMALQSSDVLVAAVATYFPSGQTHRKAKLDEVLFALNEGADEIDMVISRGEFLRGNYAFVLDEVLSAKELCVKFNSRLKVILETGELGTLDEVRKAADLVLLANPDFIKTSTGKIPSAATLPVSLVMLQAISDHFQRTGLQVGMKPAGGIADAKTALHYLVMVKEILGDKWLDKQWFRFGASRLTNDIVMQLQKQEDGAYQRPEDFTKD